jgi:hypothetical protein
MTSRSKSLLLLLTTLIPPVYLTWVVLTQTVDVPFADQWALVPVLDHFYTGTLSPPDLWGQHNEHRLFFPRLIMLGLASLSGWDTRYEMLTNVLLASAIGGVFVYQAHQTEQMSKTQLRWLIPIISLAVFSLNQAENWWSGWNIQIFLNVLAAQLGIVLLVHPKRGWLTVIGALGCGVVATYSFGNGLLFWMIGLLLLCAQLRPWTAHGCARVGVWLGGGLLTIASFFYDYHWTSQISSLSDVISNPQRYVIYMLTYLGAPITRGAIEYLFGVITGDVRAICNLGDSDLCSYVNDAAILAGGAGIVLFVLVAWTLTRKLSRLAVLPYIGLSLYALGSGALTGLTRAIYGNHQALAQRYITISTLFWLALVILLTVWGQLMPRPGCARFASTILVGLFALLIALGTLQGPDHFQWQYEYLIPAREALLKQNDDPVLISRLFPDPRFVRANLPALQRYHLSVFRLRR